MIISVQSGSSGWGKYVTLGTKDKPRDQNKIELLDGDIALGDTLSKNNKYEDSYYTLVLGFEGKPDREKIQNMYEDFKKHMFIGLKEDEYHIDSVIHYDTDDTHIHCRVPKQNLKTNTHLQLYYDKIDRPRKELLQDYISLKYGENIAREQNREVHKEEKEKVINKWRSERNNEPFNFAKKADKQLAEAEINKYIIELHNAQLIDNINDIKEVLEQSLNLKVERFGTDIKKDFSYVTISDDDGKKLRIKGEIYNDKFYEYSREDREKQIRNNKRDFRNTESSEVRLKQVQAKLRRANEKRYSRVTELFATARTRADERLSTIVQNIENEVPIDNSESISSNRDIAGSNARQLQQQTAQSRDHSIQEEYTTITKKTEVTKDEQSIRTTIKEPTRAASRAEQIDKLTIKLNSTRANIQKTRTSVSNRIRAVRTETHERAGAVRATTAKRTESVREKISRVVQSAIKKLSSISKKDIIEDEKMKAIYQEAEKFNQENIHILDDVTEVDTPTIEEHQEQIKIEDTKKKSNKRGLRI